LAPSAKAEEYTLRLCWLGSEGRLLGATLPLLGELETLVGQLLVPPFAFLVPAIRNDCQAVWRVGGEFFGLGA